MRYLISDQLLPVLKSAGTTVEVECKDPEAEVVLWIDGVPVWSSDSHG